MKVYVATKNQKKVDLLKELFSTYFPDNEIIVENGDSNSDVPETPWDFQVKNGAINRAMNAFKDIPGHDYYVGLETGLTTREGELCEETWCVIVSSNNNPFFGYASGNIIDKQIKSRVLEDSNFYKKTLEVWNTDKNDWELYSGNPKVREISLKSAIEACLAQLKYLISV